MNINLKANCLALIITSLLPITLTHAAELGLVTVGMDGKASGNAVNSRVVSRNGRFVLFTSPDALVDNDINESNWDIYQRDIETNKVKLVSVDSSGRQSADGSSNFPKMTADGQHVMFLSNATDLVPNYRESVDAGTNIYVRDLRKNLTKLVTIDRFGRSSATSGQGFFEMSDDGRFVVFESAANNLVVNDINGANDLFVRDLKLGTTKLVSTNSSNTRSANAASRGLQLSSDGRFVVFSSEATNVVAGDTNGKNDIFVRDLVINKTTRLEGAGKNSLKVVLKGKLVVFESYENNLVANDKNKERDLFVRDLISHKTKLVNINTAGKSLGNGDYSFEPALSANGRYVVFQSIADDLVTNDTNKRLDVFVRDLVTDKTELVSINKSGKASGNAESTCINTCNIMSADGKTIMFTSNAGDLVKQSDTNYSQDLFVRNMTTKTTKLVSADKQGKAMDSTSFTDIQLSKNGRYVVFDTDAGNLTARDTNTYFDVFVRDLLTENTKLISMDQAGVASGRGYSEIPVLSSDGKSVFFISAAANLVPNDTNKSYDIFSYKIQ